MQLNSRQLSHVLTVWPVARLASIGPHGRPHQIPIVFVAGDDAIYSPIDGKLKRGVTLQRIRNVARDSSVSLMLDHYDADWRRLWWLRIDADADVVSGDDVPIDRIVADLRRKYPQYGSTEVFSGAPTLLRFRPGRHVAWSAGPVEWESL